MMRRAISPAICLNFTWVRLSADDAFHGEDILLVGVAGGFALLATRKSPFLYVTQDTLPAMGVPVHVHVEDIEEDR